jgi:hypothetical protein
MVSLSELHIGFVIYPLIISVLTDDNLPGVIAWTDGTPVHARYHSDLEHYGHRDMVIEICPLRQ